jgi:hypothetical protein
LSNKPVLEAGETTEELRRENSDEIDERKDDGC